MKSYTELLEEFKEWLINNKDAQFLWELNNDGKATYIHADMYAKGIAQKWSEMLIREYGNLDFTEIVNEVADAYKKVYTESKYYSKAVQEAINQAAGINMNALEPAIDKARITNMMDKLVEDNAKFLLDNGAVESMARSGVTDTIEANAKLQSKAGLENYVIRDAHGGCCKWCRSMSGIYAYGTQPKDFWRVHKDCTCNFEYKVGKTHTKIQYKTAKSLEKDGKKNIIKVTEMVSGHDSTPKVSKPNAIIDHLTDIGKTDVRSFYNDKGLKSFDIHTSNHGNSKHHSYGNHGEHAHDYLWEDGRLKEKTTRELTPDERKENGDIL